MGGTFFCIFFLIGIILGVVLGLLVASKTKKRDENMKTLPILFALILSVVMGIAGYSVANAIFKPANSSKSSTSAERCSICGGEFKCAICGKEGMYCENASYGKGSDHYCGKHWPDVIKWHEGR